MVAILRPDDEPRTPPHSVEAEQAVLGGLMLDANAWDAVADLIAAADFYRRDHRLIFEAIAEVAEIRGTCDVITITEHLERKGRLEEVGGQPYVMTLAKDTPSAANVRAYAEIIRERSILRQLSAAGAEIAASAIDGRGRLAAELVDEAERRVFEIAERGSRGKSGFRAVRDILPDTIDRLDLLHQSPGDIRGVPTGFTLLDKKTAGLQAGDLVVIAGRPSMGKSTLAVNIAEYAAIEKNVPAAIFTMEMSSEQMTLRMISSLGRVSASHLRTGQFNDEDWSRIQGAMAQLQNAPIYLDESPALTPTELRARARRLKRERGLGLVIVDYLQLMQVPGTKENRATEISEISRGLKALAKELQVPVIAISQLNRAVEQRTDKKPVMSDLRESGAIEQDADLIALIYREEVYDQNTTRRGIADIIIAKQRNGPVGEVQLTFLGEYTRFENLVAESYGEGAF
ncbi:MAG TPA: replicative DNA helicase [Steroidobacteraceae bacterium]|jgi:replicative DNA helicase|nr:replicative DNA helicase [Steroidobacteraceae bacterium]